MENERSEPCKMQQMWRTDDAAQSMQACGSYNKKEIIKVED